MLMVTRSALLLKSDLNMEVSHTLLFQRSIVSQASEIVTKIDFYSTSDFRYSHTHTALTTSYPEEVLGKQSRYFLVEKQH